MPNQQQRRRQQRKGSRRSKTYEPFVNGTTAALELALSNGSAYTGMSVATLTRENKMSNPVVLM